VPPAIAPPSLTAAGAPAQTSAPAATSPAPASSASGAPATPATTAAAAPVNNAQFLEELRAIHAEIDARKKHMDSLTAALDSLKRVKP